MAIKHQTPMLDELEKGPWPSFVTDIKQMAEAGKDACADLLGQLELSYKKRRATGSTAASWACWVMAAALSAVIPTFPTCSRAWSTSTPCA
jgi:hypothetical protein